MPVGLVEKAKAYLGVPKPDKEVDRIPQLESAVVEAVAAEADAAEAKELALLSAEDGERGAPERLAAATLELDAAKKAKDEIMDVLRVARRVAERRAVEAAEKARIAAWREAERLLEARCAAADKLTKSLRSAGEHYEDLVRLGIEAHALIPRSARSYGGPSAYRLGPGDAAAVVGIDVLRAKLPDVARISPSMLPQYPGVADLARSSLDLIRLQRRDDEQS